MSSARQRRRVMRTVTFAIALMSMVAAVSPVTFAQTKSGGNDKPASNLEIIHEKLKADKKLIVSEYMELTESEAKKFWPVYDEYQQDLQKTNDRILKLLQSY